MSCNPAPPACVSGMRFSRVKFAAARLRSFLEILLARNRHGKSCCGWNAANIRSCTNPRRPPEILAQKNRRFSDRLRADRLVLWLVVSPGLSEKHILWLWLRHVAWGADAARTAQPAPRPGRGDFRDGKFRTSIQNRLHMRHQPLRLELFRPAVLAAKVARKPVRKTTSGRCDSHSVAAGPARIW